MSNYSWKKALAEKLNPPASSKKPRLAVVGVGSELNGDDGVGILVARRLKSSLAGKPELLILEGGNLPEIISAPLRRFKPGLVIIIDAADFNKPSGTVHFIPQEQIIGLSFSSHTMPLSILAQVLEKELDCEVLFLGVQPESLEFGEQISRSCRNAAARIEREFLKLTTDKKPKMGL